MSDELPFDEATATDDLSDEPASFSSAVSAVGNLGEFPTRFIDQLNRVTPVIQHETFFSTTRTRLVWSGLVWSGLVWSGLVWSGLALSPVALGISPRLPGAPPTLVQFFEPAYPAVKRLPAASGCELHVY
ncbi:hypothetical protein P0D88_41420 [Paraburkholderia sp. RL18-103-BIB-C]|uniref:hypothetical protein n=1 Tax=Paraburkholderia sp. RL18-103-BIB-C TaxID=3031637 RepID=UPI0038B70F17